LLIVVIHSSLSKIYTQIYTQKSMETIEERKRKYGVVYKAYVCVKGRRTSATFESKAKTMLWAEETEMLLRDGRPIPGETADDDMEFAEAVEKYTMAVAPDKKRNTRRLDQEIGKRLIAHFEGRTLRNISPKDLAAYRDHRARKVGPSSIIQDLSFLSCLYRMARVEWGLDIEDPGKEIRKPAAPLQSSLPFVPRADRRPAGFLLRVAERVPALLRSVVAPHGHEAVRGRCLATGSSVC
jgi:hypothetical protein